MESLALEIGAKKLIAPRSVKVFPTILIFSSIVDKTMDRSKCSIFLCRSEGGATISINT